MPDTVLGVGELEPASDLESEGLGFKFTWIISCVLLSRPYLYRYIWASIAGARRKGCAKLEKERFEECKMAWIGGMDRVVGGSWSSFRLPETHGQGR